jgi:hypothetical protein
LWEQAFPIITKKVSFNKDND